MEDIFDISIGSGLNPEAKEYVPIEKFISLPKENHSLLLHSIEPVRVPSHIPMTEKIFQAIPVRTFPKNADSLKDHLFKSIQEAYKDKDMPEMLYDYITQTRIIS